MSDDTANSSGTTTFTIDEAPPGGDLLSPAARAEQHGLRLPPGRWAFPVVVLAALATDLALWSSGPGLGWTIGATAAAIGVAVAARPTRPASFVLLAAVPLLAVWCWLRASPWLIGPNLIAVNACILWGASLAHRGRWFDQSVPLLVHRGLAFFEDLFLAYDWALPVFRRRTESAKSSGKDLKAVAVGLAVALPIVLALGALLASADAVFASFFDLGLDAPAIGRHVIFLTGGAWVMLALLRHASATRDDNISPLAPASATAGNVVLAAIAAVFGLYATSRLLALTGMAERIATTRGLTWAEYARSGFFQLLAVAMITLLVLVTVHGWCSPGTPSQIRNRRVLGMVNAALIIGIVVDAVHRLSGYQQAYGLTMLRLYSTAFACWIGVVFVLVAVAYGRGPEGRRWLAPAIVATALVSVFAMNVVNPEARVAERNLTGPTKVGETDVGYLAGLSDDAVVAIAPRLGSMDPVRRAAYLDNLCFARPRPRPLYNLNASAAAADLVRDEWCPDAD